MSSFSIGLTPAERISKAKIFMRRENPFFVYLVEHLNLTEAKEIQGNPLPTAAVNASGRMYYNPDFVASLKDGEVSGVLAHEVMHLAFQHPKRGKGRNIVLQGPDGAVLLWNFAVDIVVNNVLVQNNIELPSKGIIPKEDAVTILGVEIVDISKKSAEEIYEELKVSLREQMQKQQAQGKGQKGQGNGQEMGSGTITVQDPLNELGFDKHLFDEEDQQGDGGNEVPDGTSKKPVDWGQKMAEAYNHAKQIGKEPGGFGREYEILGKAMVNWRAIIRREIGKRIPTDYTWSKPNKKMIGQGIYMPSTVGEEIKVLVAIDTSGSIGRDELSEFMTEVIGIARAFQGVEVRILTHDAAVHDDILVANGNIAKLKTLTFHGGGGTDHNPVYDFVKTKKYNRSHNLLISFTDGYSCYPERPCIDTVFILAGGHCGKHNMPKWGSSIEIHRS